MAVRYMEDGSVHFRSIVTPSTVAPARIVSIVRWPLSCWTKVTHDKGVVHLLSGGREHKYLRQWVEERNAGVRST